MMRGRGEEGMWSAVKEQPKKDSRETCWGQYKQHLLRRVKRCEVQARVT